MFSFKKNHKLVFLDSWYFNKTLFSANMHLNKSMSIYNKLKPGFYLLMYCEKVKITTKKI